MIIRHYLYRYDYVFTTINALYLHYTLYTQYIVIVYIYILYNVRNHYLYVCIVFQFFVRYYHILYVSWCTKLNYVEYVLC